MKLKKKNEVKKRMKLNFKKFLAKLWRALNVMLMNVGFILQVPGSHWGSHDYIWVLEKLKARRQFRRPV